MTSPRKSRSTLRRVERAAMRWWELHWRPKMGNHDGEARRRHLFSYERPLADACAAHAAAKAKRRKGK